MVKKRNISADKLKKMLRKVGFRATPAHLALLGLMHYSREPLSPEDMIRRIGTKFDQATVYRIIRRFKIAGLIKQIDLRHNHAHYEIAGMDDHHHLVCIECGRLEDVSGCGLEEMESNILRTTRHFAEIRQHALEFYGICKQCLRSSERNII